MISLIKTLKENKIPFEIDYTSSTRTIRYNGREYYFYDNVIPQHELFFLPMVKKQVPEFLPAVNRSEIIYTFTEILKKNKGKNFKAYEIDLNKAFWQFALLNKFISPEIFERGLKVSKKTRLASLGACAKRTYHFKFDGKKYFLIKDQEPVTANVFFKVAYDVSKLMQELSIIAGNRFLFFWSDAIFFLGDTARYEIENYLEKINVGYKTREVSVCVKKNVSLVYSKQLLHIFENGEKKIINEKEEKEIRPFFHELDNEILTELKK